MQYLQYLHSCDKTTPRKATLGRRSFLWLMAWGSAGLPLQRSYGGWSRGILSSQEAGSDEYWCSAHSLSLSVGPRTTFMVVFLFS